MLQNYNFLYQEINSLNEKKIKLSLTYSIILVTIYQNLLQQISLILINISKAYT